MEVTDRDYYFQAQLDAIEDSARGGFSYENCIRNAHIMKSLGGTSTLPTAWKTGTTIVGILFADGVILGADTRATSGSEVVDKNCEKIHYIAPNIYCCGAGTAADTQKTTELIASNLELLRLQSNTPSRVVAALTQTKRKLYNYQGHIGAALILGGCDVNGTHLYSIQPHGSTQRLPYTTMGSGSLAAMAVFESRYQEDMIEKDSIELVKDSIRAGIFNDLGSGSNVDITVIRKDGSVSQFRTYEQSAGTAETYRQLYPRPNKLNPNRGTTFVISESFKPHENPITINNSEGDAMDI